MILWDYALLFLLLGTGVFFSIRLNFIQVRKFKAGLKALFGSETAVRFRPHFFPFTEPSFEIDVLLQAAGQAPRWIEIAGCGMVNPAVFENIDKETGKNMYSGCTGFAFGIGLERTAMGRMKINDLRLIFDNDVRFLNQF